MAFWCKGKKDYCDKGNCDNCEFEDGSGGFELGEDEEGIFINQWISVKDRLPELEQDVLVYAVGKGDGFTDFHIVISKRYVFRLVSTSSGIEEWQAPWPYFNRNYEVTHWMPLPEAPKEES